MNTNQKHLQIKHHYAGDDKEHSRLDYHVQPQYPKLGVF